MVNKFFNRGKEMLSSQQNSILSAAFVIMLMIVASRVLGLVRQRILAHYFTVEELSLFFAAFRLPDALFEILVFGTFSSAFIPVFTRLVKDDAKNAWKLASSIVNIGLLLFLIAFLGLVFLAKPFYGLIAPGFNLEEQQIILSLTKILFIAQIFFVVSYVLTGVLESMKRFLIPALSPIFYNLGIIIGTVLLYPKIGLAAPVWGVLIGAFLHFIIQFPLARKLGFSFRLNIFLDNNVKKIGRLAAPRVIEIMFLQVSKTVELYFSSIISTASYTFYTFGNTLQLLPVGLFGTSIAKAALPTLSEKASDIRAFEHIFLKSLREMVFIITPFAVILVVLRIPIVRLVYGTDIFSWEATVQTGMVLSAFAFGVVFQAVNALLARSFYALHNTKTPVTVSILTILATIAMDFAFIRFFKTDVWGLAAAFSIGVFVQSIILFVLLEKQINGGFSLVKLRPFLKFIISALFSASVMYFLVKFFDRSVWIKRLSFLTQIDTIRDLPFEKFVLDTRYTVNLLFLTISVSLIGFAAYLLSSYVLKTKELGAFSKLIKRLVFKHQVGPLPGKKSEAITPAPDNTQQ